MKNIFSKKYLYYLKIISLITLQFSFQSAFGQFIPAGTPMVEEFIRRNQIISDNTKSSFLLRPILLDQIDSSSNLVSFENSKNGVENFILPFQSITTFNSDRPYGRSDFGMIPNVGLQQYISGGIFVKWKFLNFQFQPEIVIAQNRAYKGFSDDFEQPILVDRFHYWNYDDSPERFGKNEFFEIWLGQSNFTINHGAFELGISSRNIWWGPGQWNSLTFSNNAKSFPHFSLNTTKPAKTFLGNFEGQVVVGKLKNSGLGPSQNQSLNDQYFDQFTGDWRYLNGITVSYNPKWIPGLFFGISRTFQQFNKNRGNTFDDFFPIFQVFQKEKFINSSNPTQIDDEARDQQATIFGRFYNVNAKFEIYFEYGRRDHAFNWREFLINPEHARAYLIGFKKLVALRKNNKFLQLRGEITHQQESVNRYIRYLGLGGDASWHTHYQVRGFVNHGQPLGVGIGTGSNIQTLEFAIVENFNKLGVIFERLENHQDFYYRAFGQQNEHQPWIDLSIGFLFDKRWENLLFSSRLQVINGKNYQWQLDEKSTPEFPKGENLLSLHSQISLVYFFNKQN
ncbi:capsule assembly Wzi family protein [Aquiflexum gelatinilyticum]|uniref:capsule assembly Wzi family protein n=1 Tax=Aquiflexum gelatinilyticum TaxID=2961943 RepID=UPI0021697193|nr:capsule assembly Wzi family protein [Aquiflexum gelatinilyticum]MCS4433110.1 capsule assembly Wzi family protein [Aquiflexum gelatinilyticum]